MKIIELEIEEVRGVRQLQLSPAGQNVVILGPNGSGKSAVVDAIDFLLTGRIGRLTGRGSGALSLTRHGPHVESDPDHAVVRASVLLPGQTAPIRISRCMGSASELVCEDEHARPVLEDVVSHASRGQHVLTRRDILQYITAEPGHRAELVQTVLDMSEVERLRQRLVRVRGERQRSATEAAGGLERARARSAAALGLDTFVEQRALEVVNVHRHALGGHPIDTVRAQLHQGINPPSRASAIAGLNPEVLERDIAAVRSAIDPDNLVTHAETDDRVRENLRELRQIPQPGRTVDFQRLVRLGLDLLDDSGQCPLCGAVWEPGELETSLRRRTEEAGEVADRLQRLDSDTRELRETLRKASTAASDISQAASELYDEPPVELVSDWDVRLEGAARLLDEPLELYSIGNGLNASDLLRSGPTLEQLTDLQLRAADAATVTTPEQNAWDSLTRIEETLTALIETETRYREEQIVRQRAEELLEAFQEARDSVLGALYDSVRNRFVQLYRSLHAEDEEDFSATLAPDGAALTLNVDFYGRGEYPPHALHSEGHQDSMGLCLFLALSEKLGEGKLDLIILDDVVMSVDADHRRHVADVLLSEFPGKQFLITTHDRTWAKQLQSNGITPRPLEFYDWSLDHGPHVHDEPDPWERIENQLTQRDIRGAAAQLRYSAEHFFSALCEGMEAGVPYRADARWDLGIVMPAAVSRFRKLVRKARTVAEDWDDHELQERLLELESITGQIFARTNAEQWAVNPAVHYNAWENFAPNDFRPVVEAFRDLFDHLQCSRCRGIYRMTRVGLDPATLGCACGAFSVSLVRRSDSS